MPVRALVGFFVFCQSSSALAPWYAYDPDLAKQFASLASVPYCQDATHVLDWTCKTCADAQTALVPGKIRLIDLGTKNATRVLIGKLRDQHGCLLSFRGSDNIRNWIEDLQIYRVMPRDYSDCKGCKVHDGFYKLWSDIQDPVMRALREVGCDQSGSDNVLYITGHSLGAALTHLAMFTLDAAGFNISKTYSFEAPRVGNKEFSEAFTDRFGRLVPVFRITHHKDPVPHLPLESMGYKQVQSEVYYNQHGVWKICQQLEDKTCADQFWNLPDLLLLHTGDHCSSSLLSNGDICNPDCAAVSVEVKEIAPAHDAEVVV